MMRRRILACLLLVIVLAPTGAAQQPPAQPQDQFVPISELPTQDQLPSAPLVIAAYSFAWIALGAYVISIARRLSAVQRELERLESDLRRGNA
jgi:CcmD family protein